LCTEVSFAEFKSGVGAWLGRGLQYTATALHRKHINAICGITHSHNIVLTLSPWHSISSRTTLSFRTFHNTDDFSLIRTNHVFFLQRTDPRGLNGNLKAHQGGSCRIHGPVKSGPAAACGPAAVTAVGRGGTSAAAQHLQDYQLDHTYDPVAADDPGRATYMQGKYRSSLH
jgi:hypothetical protein